MQPISSFFPSRKRSSEAVIETEDRQNKRPKIDLTANKFTGVSKAENSANNKLKFVIPDASNYAKKSESAMVGLPDYLQENLDLILIGDNPGKYRFNITNFNWINKK